MGWHENRAGPYNHDLVIEVSRLAASERQATGDLIAALMEFDRRRLYLGEGCSSLFTYCTDVLRLSEHTAYARIQAARAARKFPSIIRLLVDGSVTLTAVVMLAPHLDADNHEGLLAAARHKNKRDVALLVARLHPQPGVPSTVRKLPVREAIQALAPTSIATSAVSKPASAPPAAPDVPCRVEPLSDNNRVPQAASIRALAPEQYKVQMTLTRPTIEKLRRVQDLLRHTISIISCRTLPEARQA